MGMGGLRSGESHIQSRRWGKRRVAPAGLCCGTPEGLKTSSLSSEPAWATHQRVFVITGLYLTAPTITQVSLLVLELSRPTSQSSHPRVPQPCAPAYNICNVQAAIPAMERAQTTED